MSTILDIIIMALFLCFPTSNTENLLNDISVHVSSQKLKKGSSHFPRDQHKILRNINITNKNEIVVIVAVSITNTLGCF